MRQLQQQLGTGKITRAGLYTRSSGDTSWSVFPEHCENKFWVGKKFGPRVPKPHLGAQVCGGQWSHEPGYYCCWIQHASEPKSAAPEKVLFLDRDPDYPYIYNTQEPVRMVLNRSYFTKWWGKSWSKGSV